MLAPTRELASQIVEEIRDIAAARALSVAAVYGGVGFERQIKLARKAHIIVATPGRLEDLIARGAVRLDRVRRYSRSTRPTACSTWASARRSSASWPRCRATARPSFSPPHSKERPAASLRSTRAMRAGMSTPRRSRVDIEHRFLAVAHEDKLDSLVRVLRGDDSGRSLVFVRTKRGADRLVKRLEARRRGSRHARRQVPVPA